MRVLAFGAHPDDMELLCAGTLAKYAQRGDHVTMAVVTDGTKGSETLSAEEISAIRHREAEESAAASEELSAQAHQMNAIVQDLVSLVGGTTANANDAEEPKQVAVHSAAGPIAPALEHIDKKPKTPTEIKDKALATIPFDEDEIDHEEFKDF